MGQGRYRLRGHGRGRGRDQGFDPPAQFGFQRHSASLRPLRLHDATHSLSRRLRRTDLHPRPAEQFPAPRAVEGRSRVRTITHGQLASDGADPSHRGPCAGGASIEIPIVRAYTDSPTLSAQAARFFARTGAAPRLSCRPMYICLNRGTAGGSLPFEDFVKLARDSGFPGCDVDMGYAATKGAATLRNLFEGGGRALRYGGWGVPDWRGDASKWKDALGQLPAMAQAAAELRIDSAATWIMPSSDRPLMENFRFHVDRLTPVAKTLADHGLRFGLEFVAPYHLRRHHKHEFIFTPGAVLELADAVGPNVGLLVDAFHIHASGTSYDHLADPEGADRLMSRERLSEGYDRPDQGRGAAFPGDGAIDLKAFFTALRKTGYEGAVSLEVFNAELKAMDPLEAAKKASAPRNAYSRPQVSHDPPNPPRRRLRLRDNRLRPPDNRKRRRTRDRTDGRIKDPDERHPAHHRLRSRRRGLLLRRHVLDHLPGDTEGREAVPDVRRADCAQGRTAISGIGTPIRISPENSRNTCGYFSPDGRTLIFASHRRQGGSRRADQRLPAQGGNYRWSYPTGMEIFRADDWQAAVEVGRAGEDRRSREAPLTDNNAYDAEGSYSPDGKWICFTSNRTGDLEIYAMTPTARNPIQLTHAAGYDGGPFFSPDGKRLVYRSDRKGNNLLQVFVADLAFDDAGNITGMTQEHQLTDDANVNWGPFWHPDGRHIVYATSMHGHTNYEMYLMRDDGSHKTRVTFSPGRRPAGVLAGREVLDVDEQAHDRRHDAGLPRRVPHAAGGSERSRRRWQGSCVARDASRRGLGSLTCRLRRSTGDEGQPLQRCFRHTCRRHEYFGAVVGVGPPPAKRSQARRIGPRDRQHRRVGVGGAEQPAALVDRTQARATPEVRREQLRPPVQQYAIPRGPRRHAR